MSSDLSPIAIITFDDPRVELYRNVQDRDLLGRRGVFMAEGELVVRRLIRESPLPILSVLVNPVRFAAMASDLRALPPGTPVYVAEQDVFDAIAGFHIHRGVLAVGRPPEPRPTSDLLQTLPPDAVVLYLEDLHNHDNIGALFRCAAAFGAAGVILSERCADPLYRKATRVSIGATLTVPFVRDEPAGAFGALRAAGFTLVALTPDASAAEIGDWAASPARPSRVALMLGAEGPGLTRRSLDAADHRLRIGAMVRADSLNVAVAAGVALHALQISKAAPPTRSHRDIVSEQ